MIKKYGVNHMLEIPSVKEKIKNRTDEERNISSNKRKDTCLQKYGVPSFTQTENYLEKTKKTCQDKYGCNNPGQSDFVKDKRNKTIKERYGVDNISQLEEIKNKKANTCMEHYGVPIPAKSKEVMEKTRQTCLKKYNTEYAIQNEEVKAKGRKTLYENESGKASNQQRYIHQLIGGELNYPHKTSLLDIAFPDEKTYIEYIGGGHYLRVKFGHFTEKEFKKFEQKRWYALYRKGWKEIRIISQKDYLPFDEIIIYLIDYGKEYLNTGHSWIEFNIDENKIKCSQYIKDYNYGQLRIIRQDDLIN